MQLWSPTDIDAYTSSRSKNSAFNPQLCPIEWKQRSCGVSYPLMTPPHTSHACHRSDPIVIYHMISGNFCWRDSQCRPVVRLELFRNNFLKVKSSTVSIHLSLIPQNKYFYGIDAPFVNKRSILVRWKHWFIYLQVFSNSIIYSPYSMSFCILSLA